MRVKKAVDARLIKNCFNEQINEDCKSGYVEFYKKVASKYNGVIRDGEPITHSVAMRACKELGLDESPIIKRATGRGVKKGGCKQVREAFLRDVHGYLCEDAIKGEWHADWQGWAILNRCRELLGLKKVKPETCPTAEVFS